MFTIETNTILQRKNDVVDASIDDEVALMSVENGEYYSINSVAGNIWHWLKEPMSFGEVCNKIANTYDVADTDYQNDTKAFIGDMMERKLIEVSA